MWRKNLLACANAALQKQSWRWRSMATRGSPNASKAVSSIILRSLKDHYLEASRMNPPPKVSPPSPFTVLKGAIDGGGPVLKRSFGDEEISISVMRLATLIPGDGDEDSEDDGMNQLFLHVDISKPGQQECLSFLCGLYPDALGIHSVSIRPKVNSSGYLEIPTRYNGPVFEELDEKIRDGFHGYIEERGINESLFPFLQAWLYVKDHRNILRWFKSVGLFINEAKGGTSTEVKEGASPK